MPDFRDLERVFRRVDGRGYGAGKQVIGRYQDEDMLLWFTRAPADKFAPPGRLIVEFDPRKYGYPEDLFSDATKRRCLSHFLSVLTDSKLRTKGLRLMRIDSPRQVVLERTSVSVQPERIQLRIGYHFEAAGRHILGRRCAEAFCEKLPEIVRELRYRYIDPESLLRLIRWVENQEAMRNALPEMGLIAFVGNGSILPRQGNSDQPLKEGVTPFEAPESLEVSIELPHGDPVAGLGIPEGQLTCISGANFQGKTTLLEALGQGIYDHIPGDGRETVVCVRELVFANKENKRIVRSTDISPFISRLPGVDDCSRFSTPSASGSTSQAACIIDAIEAGAKAILIDEDDSAVNLLVKDNRLRRLVPSDIEPIRPLIDVIKSLPREYGVTPVMVVGALGEFTEIADTIVMMHDFKVQDATHKIIEFRQDPTAELMQQVAERLPDEVREVLGKAKEEARASQVRGERFGKIRRRVPRPVDMSGRVKTKHSGRDEILISMGGRRVAIDLRGDIQKTIVEDSQVTALADAVVYSSRYMDGSRDLSSVVDEVMGDIRTDGLDVISRSSLPGQRDYTAFTRYQLFYALSRFPLLEV